MKLLEYLLPTIVNLGDRNIYILHKNEYSIVLTAMKNNV